MADAIITEINQNTTKLAVSLESSRHPHIFRQFNNNKFSGPAEIIQTYMNDCKASSIPNLVILTDKLTNRDCGDFNNIDLINLEILEQATEKVVSLTLSTLTARAFATTIIKPDEYIQLTKGETAFFPFEALKEGQNTSTLKAKSKIIVTSPEDNFMATIVTTNNGSITTKKCSLLSEEMREATGGIIITLEKAAENLEEIFNTCSQSEKFKEIGCDAEIFQKALAKTLPKNASIHVTANPNIKMVGAHAYTQMALS